MKDWVDMMLVHEYVQRNSQDAFSELVERYVDLVYSAALRKTGRTDSAEEVTQAVFIILAKKAAALHNETIVSGWLYQTTRLAAANFLKTENRREHREKEAYMQALLGETNANPWSEIKTRLEDAMGQLREKERNVIVLRFFEGKNFQEIGNVCGVTENAAKKRVQYALEKLRKFLGKRGIVTTAAILAETISAHSVQAAPAGLATTLSATATSVPSAVLSSTLMKGTMNTMTWTKLRSTIGAGVTVLLVGAIAVAILASERTDASLPSSVLPPSTALATPESIPAPLSAPVINVQSDSFFVACVGDGGHVVKITGDSASIFAVGLNFPQGMAEDGSGNLYVTDSRANTILKFPIKAGVLSNTPIVFSSGLHGPMDLVFDRGGNMLEADSNSGTINKFINSNGGLSNTPVPIITGLTGENNPCGLCFDTQGNLYVAVSIGGIIKFAHTDFGLATTPTVFAKFSRARQMAFDRNGNLFTADHVEQRIYEFLNSPAGLSKEPTVFAENNGLYAPIGVAFDSMGNLYVTNWGYGAGTDTLEYPNINGILSNTPVIFATDFKAPGYILVYSPPIVRR